MAKSDTDSTKAAPEQPVPKKRPTPEQLQKIQSGGDYQFNPETGEMKQTRKPAKPQAKGGDK